MCLENLQAFFRAIGRTQRNPENEALNQAQRSETLNLTPRNPRVETQQVWYEAKSLHLFALNDFSTFCYETKTKKFMKP